MAYISVLSSQTTFPGPLNTNTHRLSHHTKPRMNLSRHPVSRRAVHSRSSQQFPGTAIELVNSSPGTMVPYSADSIHVVVSKNSVLDMVLTYNLYRIN